MRYLAVTFARSVESYERFLRATAPPTLAAGEDEGTTVLASIAQVNGIELLGAPGTLPGDR